jgi:N6-adenosine-specific RNA methylase IME4
MKTFHGVANIFPMMTDAEFASLKADIAENGLREAVWLHPNGSIIDGRNRYNACTELGIVPEFREWNGDGSLVSFVVSLNLHRRHLTESQRAMVAAKLANMPEGRPNETTASIEAVVSQPEAAELLSVSRSAVQRAKAVQETGTPELIAAVERGQVSVSAAADVATLPQEQQAEIVAKGEKDILAAAKEIREKRGAIRREERVNRINEIALGNQPLSGSMDRLFPVVYADPPWRYEHSQTANREIENHYPTMTLEEICALPVGDIVTPDSILFLWTTSPKLEESMQVIAAWGFTYRTCLVWVKDKIGMGYYARQRHELLLVAKRGSIPVPDTDARFDSVIECPRVEHSKKPDVVYGMIDKMYPHFDKVELFARQTTDGWYTWGNQS